MKPNSLFEEGRYSLGWIKDFYNQAGIWWGPDPQEAGVHPARVETVARLCGPAPKRILELGAGPGATATALADAGHTVVAIELADTRAAYARALAASRVGKLTVLQGDYFTLPLDGRFEAVCCWETFGLGSDADQLRLLQRIAHEWLAPGGRVLMDVFNPVRPARDAGKESRLAPLKGVPGSVEMFERCHFDPVHSRWIDEWVPAAAPEQALAQSIRCYSPADFQLLLEGSGLALVRIEVDGVAVEWDTNAIILAGPLMNAWNYLAVLR